MNEEKELIPILKNEQVVFKDPATGEIYRAKPQHLYQEPYDDEEEMCPYFIAWVKET